MLRSKDTRVRLRALKAIREQISVRKKRGFLKLAVKEMRDQNETCRWQAAIILGEFIETDLDTVWRIVRKYAHSPDRNTRTAIATVLVEHMFQLRFPEMKLRLIDAIRSGDSAVADMVKDMWRFGEAEEKWSEIETLLDTAARNSSVFGSPVATNEGQT